MKFVDEAFIEVAAGKGGAGMSHFRREKFVPLGGPDGGDGGSGGSIIAKACRNKKTLIDFKYQPKWRAENGKSGGTNCRNGKCGANTLIELPIGTEILNAENEELLADLCRDGQEFMLAQGGRGGRGNSYFKSATNRSPDHAQPGEQGQSGTFKLSLKLVADVGIIGFPNAGKSTLISRISAARPKIADYPFTTLEPNLGVVDAGGGRSFVVADIPGLIPGAHGGKGLGIKFLKHIERTRVLLHLIDPNQLGAEGRPVPAEEAFDAINRELAEFSTELAAKRQIVAISKVDAVTDGQVLAAAKAKFKARGVDCLEISSISGAGISELIEMLAHE